MMTRSSDLLFPLSEHHTPFSEKENHAIREVLRSLLINQATAYTKGESSSLPTETMEELLRSLCYTLDLSLRAPADALDQLLNQTPESIYQRQYEALKRKTERAKWMISELCLTAPNLGCIALRDTLISLKQGIDRYDTRFFAHRIPGSIDYQLLRSVPESIQGIDYSLQYMLRLNTELCFIRRFALHRVLALLDGTDPDWRELTCNLYAPIATNALGLTLLGDNPLRLHISNEQRAALLEQLRDKPKHVVETELFAAASRLCKTLKVHSDHDAALLISLSMDLAPRIVCACCSGDLAHIFFSFGLPKKKGENRLSPHLCESKCPS